MSAEKKKSDKPPGTQERKSSSGNLYARDQNGSAEGNDPSLTAGKTLTRKVPAKK